MNNSNIKPIEYVGVDYHTKYALATRMTKAGQIISQDKIDNTRDAIREYMAALPSGSLVAVEATNNWYAFCEFCHGLPIDIKLVHPTKTRAIASARIKTDSLDSKVLADLLRGDLIAESYLAPEQVRDVRELVRYRTTLARTRARFMVRIRSVLFKIGTQIPAKKGTGKGGREQLAALSLRDIYRAEIDSCLTVCDQLNVQIEQFEKQITEQAEADEDTRLLMTIPGISFYSAVLLTSEIGDFTRFSSAKKLAGFFGLVPATYSSGGKTRRGRITKQGNANLRWVLLEAVKHVIKKSVRLKKRYDRILKKHGKRTAKVAVAREMVTIILAMLKSRQQFNALR